MWRVSWVSLRKHDRVQRVASPCRGGAPEAHLRCKDWSRTQPSQSATRDGGGNCERFGVRTVIVLSEARQRALKIVCVVKWLDVLTLEGDARRCEVEALVATEINSYGRMDVSQSTLSIKCFKLILLLAPSRTDSSGHDDRLVARSSAVRVALLSRARFWQDRSDPSEQFRGKRLPCWFSQ